MSIKKFSLMEIILSTSQIAIISLFSFLFLKSSFVYISHIQSMNASLKQKMQLHRMIESISKAYTIKPSSSQGEILEYTSYGSPKNSNVPVSMVKNTLIHKDNKILLMSKYVIAHEFYKKYQNISMIEIANDIETISTSYFYLNGDDWEPSLRASNKAADSAPIAVHITGRHKDNKGTFDIAMLCGIDILYPKIAGSSSMYEMEPIKIFRKGRGI
ncbi:MAG: hypothetical protein KAH32_02515 [Chlamydiia bacterium]|nr:hypothetical protein [Chlamydiia bacterium]